MYLLLVQKKRKEKKMSNKEKKITSRTLIKMKEAAEKITMLTAYDFATAKYVDECGIDSILIGDSLGMTMLGYDSTVNVTMDDMILFTKAVARGVKKAMVIADMPFMSFQVSKEKTLINAGNLIQAGADAVKIEGGSNFIIEQITALTEAGIGVIAHLGFTPQYISTIGGYFIQGKSYENTVKILETAQRIQNAGACALVLEMMSEEAAKYISENLTIPTIGIGAGRYCDGQVLVIDDVLGRYHGNVPKFAKQYANIKDIIKKAVLNYNDDVKNKIFPSEEHIFKLTNEEKDKFNGSVVK